jgi:hypothetical protein
MVCCLAGHGLTKPGRLAAGVSSAKNGLSFWIGLRQITVGCHMIQSDCACNHRLKSANIYRKSFLIFIAM